MNSKKMKKYFFLLGFFCALEWSSILFSQDLKKEEEAFLHTYPSVYQDILVQNRVILKGSDRCDVRYNLIKPILNLYKRPFTVLDVGAAEGYFSLKIAEEYNNATCVMLEGGINGWGYGTMADKLQAICNLNSHLNNIIFLKHLLSLKSLQTLNKQEHFDVVLAFLVIHIIAGQAESLHLKYAKNVIKEFLKLGDNIIVEVATNVGVEITGFIEILSEQLDCEYLGLVPRYAIDDHQNMGKLFWFKRRNTFSDNSKEYNGISLNTFNSFGGIYPDQEKIHSLKQDFSEIPSDELIIQGNQIIKR